MIGAIDVRLKQAGYQFLKVQPEEAGVYYRFEEGKAWIIIGIHAHDTFSLNATQIGIMQRNLRELFLHPQGKIEAIPTDTVIYNVELVTLIISSNADQGKELCANSHATWFLDTKQKRLMIYENQPGDFHGLYDMIQSIIVEEASKEARREAADAAGSNAKMEKMQGRSVDWKTYILTRPNGRPRAIMNTSIVIINVIIYLILTLIGDTQDGAFIIAHGGLYPPLVLDNGEWYRLFTAMFLHFGIYHISNNMVILFFVGDKLEYALGKWKYLLIYLVSGLGGSLLSLYMMVQTNEMSVSAGASGAIFGVIGALLCVAIKNRGRVEGLTSRGLVFMTALCLYFGLSSTGVDNWCHIGGLLTGFLMSFVLYRKKFRKD